MANRDTEYANKHTWALLILIIGAVFLLGSAVLALWSIAHPIGLALSENAGNSLPPNSAIAPNPSSEAGVTEGELATHEPPPTPTPVSIYVPQETTVPLPILENPLLEEFQDEAMINNAQFLLLDQENTGIWQFEKNSFVHPISLEISQDTAFLLDAGRVLAVDLDNPAQLTMLLQPGEKINDVLVLEPLDLGLTADALLILDRAGDVYSYDLNNKTWSLDRYDRPVEETSGHYFVAVEGIEKPKEPTETSYPHAALLETNYQFTMLYGGETTPLWNLPEARSVDVSENQYQVFVLQQEMYDSRGTLNKYIDTGLIKAFNPQIEIDHPLQVVATDGAVFILDQAGRRLRAVDPENGNLLQVYQVPQNDQPSAFAITSDQKIVLAARDRLYFFEEPKKQGVILGDSAVTSFQPHDPEFLATLDSYTVPIGGSNITVRDFQMPGAPRHYRLGIHHGLDFYWQPGTKVLSTADGVVIRADLDYIPPTSWQLSAWWTESQELGYTSTEILDKYLGRQVWIEHEGGQVSRYAHLRSIEPGITEGIQVSQGQIIGEVGNSGSPASLESDQSDAHLHFELWFGDNYLGQFLRPIEVREWVEQIFSH